MRYYVNIYLERVYEIDVEDRRLRKKEKKSERAVVAVMRSDSNGKEQK